MMSVERNERALIELVQTAAASRRTALIGAARAQARQILQNAHAQARRSVRVAFEAERRGAGERLAAARALLDTRRRLAQQRRNAALLVAAWEALPDVLITHWRQDRSRKAWIDATLCAAIASLPKRHWRFVLAPGCSAAECAALLEVGRRETGSSPRLDEAPGLRAGIAIEADGARVDATLDGLVADRADVEALLLKRFDELRAPARRDVCRE